MIDWGLLNELKDACRNNKCANDIMAAAKALVAADDGYTNSYVSVTGCAFGQIDTTFYITVRYAECLEDKEVDRLITDFIKRKMHALELTNVYITDEDADLGITNFDLIIAEDGTVSES